MVGCSGKKIVESAAEMHEFANRGTTAGAGGGEVEQRIKVWESAEKMRAFHVDDSVKECLKKGIAGTSNSGTRRGGEWDQPR